MGSAASILNNIKPCKKLVREIDFGEGNKISLEFREPTAKAALEIYAQEGHQEQMWKYILECCYEVGTDTKVFEPAHKDSIFSIGIFADNNILTIASEALQELAPKGGKKSGEKSTGK